MKDFLGFEIYIYINSQTLLVHGILRLLTTYSASQSKIKYFVFCVLSSYIYITSCIILYCIISLWEEKTVLFPSEFTWVSGALYHEDWEPQEYNISRSHVYEIVHSRYIRVCTHFIVTIMRACSMARPMGTKRRCRILLEFYLFNTLKKLT